MYVVFIHEGADTIAKNLKK